MTNKYNLRELIEGAILVSVWLVILLISIYSPFFIIGSLLLPIPFTIIAYRNGDRVGLLSALMAIILSLLMNLFVIGFTIIISSIIVGLVAGYSIRKSNPRLVTFVMIAVAVLVSNLLGLLFLWGLTDYNMVTELRTMLEESFVAAGQMMTSMGMENNVNTQSITTMISMVELLLPTILIASSVLLAYIYYQLLYFLLNKLSIRLDPLPSPAAIRLPREILTYFIVASLLMIFMAMANSVDSFIYVLAFNVVQILSMAFGLQGIGIVWYFMTEKKFAKGLKIITTLILFHPILLQIMTWVGILDMFFNWRRRPSQS